MNIQCKVCMATFLCTMTEAKLKEHSDNKHPKHDFYQCFPHLKQYARDGQPPRGTRRRRQANLHAAASAPRRRSRSCDGA